MKYSVACNWDPELLDRLSHESSSVDSLFGQITDDPFGGGRGSFFAPKVFREQAEEFIAEARKPGFPLQLSPQRRLSGQPRNDP